MAAEFLRVARTRHSLRYPSGPSSFSGIQHSSVRAAKTLLVAGGPVYAA
jgi:hypothetical protein